MRKRKIYDPYAELLGMFNKGHVKYVVIGMSGINYYAASAPEAFTTQDFDIFLKPTTENIKKALIVLKNLGFDLSADSVKDIVKSKKTVLAVNPYGITLELLLKVSGYTFDQMSKDAVIFSAQKVPVKVARLSKLLQSKKLAGRPKDRLFLKRYELLLKGKC